MNPVKNSNKYILLDNLFNLFLDTNILPEDEELFNEWDINIDNIVHKNMYLFHQLRTQARAELNLSKHNRIKEFLIKLKLGLDSSIDEYKSFADEVIANPKFAELQPMFRNLNELSYQDKKSVLIDAKLLDMLDEIEKEFYGKHNKL